MGLGYLQDHLTLRVSACPTSSTTLQVPSLKSCRLLAHWKRAFSMDAIHLMEHPSPSDTVSLYSFSLLRGY